jgi:hypothetical protein
LIAQAGSYVRITRGCLTTMTVHYISQSFRPDCFLGYSATHIPMYSARDI